MIQKKRHVIILKKRMIAVSLSIEGTPCWSSFQCSENKWFQDYFSQLKIPFSSTAQSNSLLKEKQILWNKKALGLGQSSENNGAIEENGRTSTRWYGCVCFSSKSYSSALCLLTPKSSTLGKAKRPANLKIGTGKARPPLAVWAGSQKRLSSECFGSLLKKLRSIICAPANKQQFPPMEKQRPCLS
jgi:hypothetical protein